LIRIAQQVKEREVCREHKKAQKEGEVADMTRSFLVEEGKLEASRDLALLLLPKKLGPMPSEIEKAIRELNDLNRIQAIMAQFLEISNWQQLKQYLN